MKIGVLGAGTWGIALAKTLCENGHNVTVWSALENEISYLKTNNCHYNLPEVILPRNIDYTLEISKAINNMDFILFAVASKFQRSVSKEAAPFIKENQIVINVSKGLEPVTLFSMTDIIKDEYSNVHSNSKINVVALSGPTHAEEVAVGIPTAIVSACEDEIIAKKTAEIFMNSCMRVYTNTDVLGVEICGALKNIIALSAGILRGLGAGDNTNALLMTRGIAEMTRIGLAMGCKRRTFMGLAGIGDLIVTCTSRHSRNNRCGELLGKGYSYEEAAKEIGMVVEGYYALDAARELSIKYNIEMPITDAVYSIAKENANAHDTMQQLMLRAMRSELD